MKKFVLFLVLLSALGLGYVYYQDSWVKPESLPQPVLEPIQPPVEPKIKPNEETAPKSEPEPVVVPAEPRRSGPIRYDREPERPWGYYDYCQRYPSRPECGRKQ